jgi:hypothetical protein
LERRNIDTPNTRSILPEADAVWFAMWDLNNDIIAYERKQRTNKTNYDLDDDNNSDNYSHKQIQDLTDLEVFPKRYDHHVWVAYSAESPALLQVMAKSDVMGLFSYSRTYRKDSTAPITYFYAVGNELVDVKEKKGLVAFVASNCGMVHNYRNEYHTLDITTKQITLKRGEVGCPIILNSFL